MWFSGLFVFLGHFEWIEVFFRSFMCFSVCHSTCNTPLNCYALHRILLSFFHSRSHWSSLTMSTLRKLNHLHKWHIRLFFQHINYWASKDIERGRVKLYFFLLFLFILNEISHRNESQAHSTMRNNKLTSKLHVHT